ncbi:MAG: tyrosine-type recombinase/integrase [Leptospiraceae bacterium]|nr:tyrosine-type recombinase/integrase [Leptospiraceae bacterium]MCP5500664.1 tyrosine-type recombinase/integrase [Leptospiraceae bacterium]
MKEKQIQFPDKMGLDILEPIETFKTFLEKEKNYSKNTLIAYQRDIKFFLEYCQERRISFFSPSPEQIISYFQHLENSGMEKKTRSRKFSSFKVFYSYLNRVYGENTSIIEFLYKNEGPKKESGRKEKNDYRSSSAFLLEKRDRAILEILYSSGIRVFELVNARLEDLSEDNKILRVFGKKEKSHFISLGENARKVLDEYLTLRKVEYTDREFIFLNQKGNRLTTRGIRYILNERKNLMGMDKKVTPHRFRNTFARDLLDAGEDIREVQKMLGQSTSNERMYHHVSNERLKEIYRNAHPHARK